MKKEIAAYVARCDTCCRVKAIHMKPAGLLQPLSIPEWKWEEVSMDFITGLPTTRKGNDSIWVIIDRLTKSAHFIPVKNTYRPPEYADIYIAEIVKLHGIPKTIISDRGPQFTAHFWERMHKFGDQSDKKHGVSSPDFRSNGEAKPSIRRYAEGLCAIVQGIMGVMVTSG